MNRAHVLGYLWNECLSLAVEAMAAGSLGISGVITTPEGQIVSRGRNQLFDSYPSCNPVKNTQVSHAELNAIAGLPSEYRHRRDLTLHTTVEPCPLCIGAIAMSRIRDVRVACHDGWAGGVNLLSQNDYLSKKAIQVSFEDGVVERAFALLHMVSVWIRFDEERRSDTQFFEALANGHRKYLPLVETLGVDSEFLDAVQRRDEITALKKLLESDTRAR